MNRFICGILLLFLAIPALAQISITYQGQLQDQGQPFSGEANLAFQVYQQLEGGAPLGNQIVLNNVSVSDGLFQVELDFGPFAPFNSSALRYLEIEVNGSVLTPRQKITAAPRALFAARPWQKLGLNLWVLNEKVGIGTTGPATRLDVIGNAKFGGLNNESNAPDSFVGGGDNNKAISTGSFIGGGSGNTSSGLFSFVGGGQLNTAAGESSFAAGRRAFSEHDGTFVWDDDISSVFASTGPNQFLIRAAGGVGIGTNSPSAQLHVARDSGIPLLVSLGGQSRLWVNSNGGTSLGTNGTPPSRGLRVHGVSQFEDRVGIHTFVPGRQLHVRQTTTSSASSGITIERAPPSTNQWGLYVNTSDGLNLVYNNSTVGIFNPATGVYSATSDARLKTNLQPIGEVLDRVLALKPSSYHMNGQDDFAPRSIGLIAQQVEPLFPEIVTRMDDEGDLMGLRYSELSVLNVQAIIELNARLESNVAMLADENAELRERLAVLESLLLEQVPVVAETGR